MSAQSVPVDFNAAALDPARSVVIEACAGSGKTWLLVSRVIRLLLAGAAPGEILAITFTRKAAQEMEARLRDWLRLLALGSDAEVRAFLAERALEPEAAERALPRARELYETYLTAQPGLTINTFHGWFLQLLQRAPLQSGLPGADGLIEQTSTLAEEAWQTFADDLRSEPSGTVAESLDELFREFGLGATRGLLLSFLGKRGEWWAYTAAARDPVAVACARLREELGVDPQADPLGAVLDDARLRGDLESYRQLLERGPARDQEMAREVEAALGLHGDGAAAFELVWSVCFTSGGTPRKRESSAAMVKRLGEDGAQRFLELHDFLCSRLQALRDAHTAQRVYRINRAAFACGVALLQVYERLKSERQAQDFTDVEWRVCQLLERSEFAECMQYKLDARYRHVLLDEFQDTNPFQWQALKSWFAASAAVDSPPTVFMVGDPKQSIYRFRRAEPRLFEIAAHFLESRFGATRLRQNTSRRCAPAVIEAVNAVFDGEPAFSGFVRHAAHETGLPGRVVRLPVVLPEASPQAAAREGLRNPLLEPRVAEEDLRYQTEAELVARGLTQAVGRVAVTHGGSARALEYRDVMLLVRRRTHLATYEAALRRAGIPYVSTRQGGLLETLECADLIALLEFLSLPFADLKLAQVLRSPMFAVSDQDLMALASSNEGGSWWRRLQRLAAAGESATVLGHAARLLGGWLSAADRLPVHDLLDRVYFESDLMNRYADAVPPSQRAAVLANLNAFMELALAVDSGRYPSLGKFLGELAALSEASDQEAPDEGVLGDIGNAVRIHTIHESKGLEAPLVWLIDASGVPRGDTGCRMLIDWPPQATAPGHVSVLLGSRQRAAAQAPHLETEQAQAAREDLNLLYVALTRARQYLVVSGGESARSGITWYDRLAPLVPAAEGDWAAELPAAGHADARGATPEVAVEVDPRLLQPQPTGARERSVRTSALAHGTAVHALLEWSAPPHGIDDPDILRLRFDGGAEEFEAAWAEAQSLLQSPVLRRFFDPARYLRAWKELPYRRAGGEYRRIDRVVEFESEVWILDYKTGEAGAATPEQRAAGYRDQLREYREALRLVFAAKPIRCALVFGPHALHEL